MGRGVKIKNAKSKLYRVFCAYSQFSSTMTSRISSRKTWDSSIIAIKTKKIKTKSTTDKILSKQSKEQ